MRLSLKQIMIAVGMMSLASSALLAESSQHYGGASSLRRSAGGTGSTKKLSDIVNACATGRGARTGLNTGIGQARRGIGTGPITPPPGDDTKKPNPIALMPAKCLKCHQDDPKSPEAALELLQGTRAVPSPMKSFMAGLSAAEKAEFVSFFEKQVNEGRGTL